MNLFATFLVIYAVVCIGLMVFIMVNDMKQTQLEKGKK